MQSSKRGLETLLLTFQEAEGAAGIAFGEGDRDEGRGGAEIRSGAI